MTRSNEQSMRAVGSPVACLAVLAFVAAAVAVDMPVVPVGNPGNAAYQFSGAVAYAYQIGKYEVTAGQYTEFLNAVARTDTYGLYNVNMDTAVDAYGCNILRSGTPGNYSYAVAPDWANRPVNFVSWGDAARFANWMHNGQPATGAQDATTTEDGSYLLNGAMTDRNLILIHRKPSASWVLPSENEWVKAAYHKNNGPSGDYWLYPTQSDSTPSNVIGSPEDPGNSATFAVSAGDGEYSYTLGSPYWRTEGGEHQNSPSAYGTFDQGGNVAEWNEGIKLTPGPALRMAQGGRFTVDWKYMRWDYKWMGVGLPADELPDIGFRLALVPEPGCVLLLMCGVGAWAVRPRRRVTR